MLGGLQARKVEDLNNGTYEVTYTAAQAGWYTIMVMCGGVPLPSCPIRLEVSAYSTFVSLYVNNGQKSKYRLH